MEERRLVREKEGMQEHASVRTEAEREQREHLSRGMQYHHKKLLAIYLKDIHMYYFVSHVRLPKADLKNKIIRMQERTLVTCM
jgi:hypothetical protein